MKAVALMVLSVAGLGAVAPAQDEVEFERDVLPILRAHCVECHRAPQRDADGRTKKPKGGLRLDGRAWILRGSDAGAVVEPGSPEDSELWLRTRLPADDPDVMPSEGDPLTTAQTETLRRWIADGADFGAWQGAAGPADAPATPAPAVEPAGIRRLETLAEGVPAPPSGAIDRAVAAQAQVRGVLGSDLRLLRVSFQANQEAVGDDTLGVLTPLRAHVAELDLARTKITDAALNEVARMPRLVRLDLGRTGIGDRGVRQLRGLEHLRSLNLFGTRVTDAAVESITALPALESVYVWQTAISAEGIAKLHAARPDLRVVAAPDLPAPAPAPDSDGPRRRR